MSETQDITANRHGGNKASVEAHRRVRHTAETQRKWVMDQVGKSGERGLTVDELAELASKSTGHDVGPNRISGRVSELVAGGELLRTKRRRSTRTGSSAAIHVVPEYADKRPVWHPAPVGRPKREVQETLF